MILQPVTDASIIFLSVVFSNMKLNIDVSETSLTMEVPAITSPRISCRQTARIDAYEKHRCIKDKVKKCFILSKMCFRQDPRTRFPSRSNIFIFEFVYFKEGRRKLSNLFIQDNFNHLQFLLSFMPSSWGARFIKFSLWPSHFFPIYM